MPTSAPLLMTRNQEPRWSFLKHHTSVLWLPGFPDISHVKIKIGYLITHKYLLNTYHQLSSRNRTMRDTLTVKELIVQWGYCNFKSLIRTMKVEWRGCYMRREAFNLEWRWREVSRKGALNFKNKQKPGENDYHCQ